MADVHSAVVRSKNMSAVRRRDTKPELLIRRRLFAEGFRYRLDVRSLPGRPDIVLTKYNAAIFVHGCFWHRHDCELFRMPASRADFWQHKLTKNVERDQRNVAELKSRAWRVGVIWECALRGKGRLEFENLISDLKTWLLSNVAEIEMRGR
ncbi:very short patch repair endonuclease [Aurantiacibacter sp. MUD61]|uniref:very short patch repair endonuclease n=1 Tax=Aurantiacibacter sp. MUD61 TaxID=3009083 RepID=UPI0022F04574|nr:DNA mismatch endonuclease Vsr [Aurantiacibacter sp. MUD61]